MVPISQMKSPGVFIDEVDLSTYVAIMDTSKIFGIVTLAQNGPIGEVTEITSTADFENIFGNPISPGGLACAYVASITSSLKVVRAAGASAAYRTANIPGVDAEDTAIANALVITPQYKGTLYSDAITVAVTNLGSGGSNADRFNIIINKGTDDDAVELVNQNFTIDPTKASADYPYIVGDESTDFRFSLGSTTTVAKITTTTTPITLSAGDNGLTLTDDNVRSFIDLLDDAENIDLDIIAAPDLLSAAGQLRLITVAESRKDCFAVLDTPQGLSPDEAAEYVNGTSQTHPIQKLDTSYAGIYYPWGRVYNTYSGAYEWVPASVGVLPAMATEYQTYDNWKAPAGSPRFLITVFSELERTLKRPERDTLYENHINPLCDYKQRGLTALGQKTLQRKLSSLDRINVRFLINYIKRMADYSTVGYLFMDINDNTFEMWIKEIKSYLEPIRQRGGLYDFKVTMDWTTVTPEYLNNNIMPGIIQVKPTKVAEYIPIDVVIKNRSDDFD